MDTQPKNTTEPADPPSGPPPEQSTSALPSDQPADLPPPPAYTNAAPQVSAPAYNPEHYNKPPSAEYTMDAALPKYPGQDRAPIPGTGQQSEQFIHLPNSGVPNTSIPIIAGIAPINRRPVIDNPKTGNWKQDILACHVNIPLCLLTFCCPAVTAGYTMQHAARCGFIFAIVYFIVHRTYQMYSETIMNAYRHSTYTKIWGDRYPGATSNSANYPYRTFSYGNGENRDINEVNGFFNVNEKAYELPMQTYLIAFFLFLFLSTLIYRLRTTVMLDRQIKESKLQTLFYSTFCQLCTICQTASEYGESFFQVDCTQVAWSDSEHPLRMGRRGRENRDVIEV